jgi:broad specificity phosphatase PhoE
MKIFLCRHGQTTGDLEDRYGGDYEDHLTDEGKIQAGLLAEKLVGKNIEIIMSSPRIRALETSDILRSKLNIQMQVLENLRERNHYGILTGLVKSEAKVKYPQEVELIKDFYTNATGGEDYQSFKNRILRVLHEITTSKYQIVALITHGGPIRFIFREVLKLGETKIADCSFAELETSGNDIKVINLDGIEIIS